jgi:predicted nuclease of restriction endonuclease-like RecB superfamily
MFRRKGAIKPIFVREPLGIFNTMIQVYKEHVGKKRGSLNEVISDCEYLGYNYKTVRGIASVLNTRATFQSKSSIPPLEARRQVFTEASKISISSETERKSILEKVAKRNKITVKELDDSIYADLENEQYLTKFYAPNSWELMRYYNYANMVALLTYSSSLELSYNPHDEYLESLIKRIAKPEKRGKKNIIELKPTRRMTQRAAKIDDVVKRLIKKTEWSLQAYIKYPPRYKTLCRFEIDSKTGSNLLASDSYLEETIIEIDTIQKESSKYGDIIVIDEIARLQGKTSSQVINEIKREKTKYIDLGGVYTTPEKHEEINKKLETLSTINQVQTYFKEIGIKDVLTVLESFGYQVEWSNPRKNSKIYRL